LSEEAHGRSLVIWMIAIQLGTAMSTNSPRTPARSSSPVAERMRLYRSNGGPRSHLDGALGRGPASRRRSNPSRCVGLAPSSRCAGRQSCVRTSTLGPRFIAALMRAWTVQRPSGVSFSSVCKCLVFGSSTRRTRPRSRERASPG
jgi:hypothetical protein